MSLKETEERLRKEAEERELKEKERQRDQALWQVKHEAEQRRKLANLICEICERPGWNVTAIDPKTGVHELSLPGLERTITVRPGKDTFEMQYSDDTAPVEVTNYGPRFAGTYWVTRHNEHFFRWEDEEQIVRLLRSIEGYAEARRKP